MNRIERLIEKLCPNGVEWKTLGEVCENFIVPMRDRPKVFDGDIPWCRIEDADGVWLHGSKIGLAVSQAVIDSMNLKVMPAGTVICSCSASLGRYLINSRPLITNQTFIGLVCGASIKNKYLRYLMETQTGKLVSLSNSGTIPYISRKKFEQLSIPVPPIEVQGEIVQILDNFANLKAELEAELAARIKQYQQYRDTLLSGDWPRVKLGAYFKRLRGTPITAAKMKEIAKVGGTVRIFAGGKTIVDADEEDILNANITRVPAVLVQSRGVIDFVYYDKPFTFKNEMWAYTSTDVISVRYLYYVLKNHTQFFRDAASGMGSLPQISLRVTEDYEIPLPPLAEQERIVGILDKFDKLVNSLTEGLPAEISARQKQYEYYRDKLLSFGKEAK